ncbi:hypothetical protein F4801DRAFT_439895 [Xylaria longipes]|nr:hypothetical protein F4801DRAFT_439895 [Xylaria longipes]
MNWQRLQWQISADKDQRRTINLKGALTVSDLTVFYSSDETQASDTGGKRNGSINVQISIDADGSREGYKRDAISLEKEPAMDVVLLLFLSLFLPFFLYLSSFLSSYCLVGPYSFFNSHSYWPRRKPHTKIFSPHALVILSIHKRQSLECCLPFFTFHTENKLYWFLINACKEHLYAEGS